MREVNRGSGSQDRLSAYSDAVRGHGGELIQRVRKGSENVGQARSRECQRRRRAHAEQDHARVRLVLNEDQSSKMAVVRDQDASFAVGHPKHLGIG